MTSSRSRSEHRGCCEEDDAGEKHALAAEEIAGTTTEEEEAAEDERVGVHDPLQPSLELMSSAILIDGSATLVIVASRITMNCARQTSTRTIQGLT